MFCRMQFITSSIIAGSLLSTAPITTVFKPRAISLSACHGRILGPRKAISEHHTLESYGIAMSQAVYSRPGQ